MDIRSLCRQVHRQTSSPKGKKSCTLDLEALEDRCLLAAGYGVVNLASDVPGLARVTDANLANPWGLAFSPTGPFWTADNSSGVSDLLDGRAGQIPLVVTIPGAAGAAGTPTGVVFNGGPGFVVSENGVSGESQFLFASEDGTISGWAPGADMARAIVAVDNSASGAIYKGLALATDASGHSFLFATDFHAGTIDVFDESFHQVQRSGAFVDPAIPNGYAPFNVKAIGNLLYVTYARQDAAGYDDLPGAGHGFIDVYDISGNLVRRFASQGVLDSPWGLAMAPADFGPYGGALLVGNNGDGTINAFNPASGAFLGALADGTGQPITAPGIWGLTFGNGHMGGDADTLFFDAGIDNDSHGLFGAIQSPQKLGADTGGTGTFDPSAPGERFDYPLPPMGGPAMQDSAADHSIPTSVLLPLTNSSLVLVPTLYAVPQTGTATQASAATSPFITATFSRSGSATVVATSASFFPDDSQGFEGSAPTGALALSTFLDVDALRTYTADAGAAQNPTVTMVALGNNNPPSAYSDAGGAPWYVQPTGARPLARAGVDQDGARLANQQAQAAAHVLLGSPVSLSAGPTVAHETAAGPDQGKMAVLLRSLLGVFGISLVWGYSLMGRARPRTCVESIEPANTLPTS